MSMFKYDQMGQKVSVMCERSFRHSIYHAAKLNGLRKLIMWEGEGIGTEAQKAAYEKYMAERTVSGYPRELLY